MSQMVKYLRTKQFLRIKENFGIYKIQNRQITLYIPYNGSMCHDISTMIRQANLPQPKGEPLPWGECIHPL